VMRNVLPEKVSSENADSSSPVDSIEKNRTNNPRVTMPIVRAMASPCACSAQHRGDHLRPERAFPPRRLLRQGQPLSASCSSLVISSVVASTVRFTTLAAFVRPYRLLFQ
jgi:hypothetical protein